MMLADKRALISIGLVLGALGIFLLYIKLLSAGLGILGMLVLIFIFKFVMKGMESKLKTVKKQERQALRGADAEDEIADLLSDLPDNYRVFNDVDTGTGDIDHVLIRKDGVVFAVETKSHHGKVTFSGNDILINGNPPEKNFIGQVLRNAYWVKDRIKEQTGQEVWVNAVLVFSNAFVNFHAPIKGVQVLNKKFLIKHIEGQKTRREVPDVWEEVRL